MSIPETLAQLIAIDSVSARSNKEIVDYLDKRCVKLGFTCQRHTYVDDAAIEKTNLVALSSSVGEDEWVQLALVGHTDTVPFDPNWTEATTLVERDGNLYGRGSCDTKGFIAAVLTAVERVELRRLKQPLALIFTADEEIGLIGAKRLAQSNPFKVRYSIVGEPTSLQPIRAGKGYALAEVLVRGREAHSAYPALGSSAIFGAARLISRIEQIGKQITGLQHPLFEPPFTTLNVGMIRGGNAKNVIAGECRFTLEWRPIPGQDSSTILNLINEAVEAEKRLDPDFECEVDANRSDSGFETASDSRLVSFLERNSGREAGTVSFGTEAAQLMRLGCEAVVIGPGDIKVAHRTGEFVPKVELERCTDILAQAIKEFCG